MKKYLLSLSMLLLGCGLVSYIAWKYFAQEDKLANVFPGSNELIFTQDEERAIGQWRDAKSLDELTKDAFEGDSAGLWMMGMSSLTGAMGFSIDSKSADKFFSWSASLGFAPSLDQVRRMYAFDLHNPFLSLVYLSLTVSMGHMELMKLYHKMRTELIDAGGLKAVNEIEKIAIHKRNLISDFTDSVKNNPNEFIKQLLSKGSIADEDVLFDMEFWKNILNGSLVTGDLEVWLKNSNNYCRKIERLSEEAKQMNDRLNVSEEPKLEITSLPKEA